VWPSNLVEHDPQQLSSYNEHFGLIAGLADLRELLLHRTEPDVRRCHIVAIAIVLSGLSPYEREQVQSRLVKTTPAVPDSSWILLGYDIADIWFVSGLSNCGYEANERQALSDQFGQHLNQHHLFADFSQANQFRLISNRRIPEHAPFYVFGLYLVNTRAHGTA
jgi:hypothetical protein